MRTTKTDLREKLQKKFHTICTINGIGKEEKEAMLSSFGVCSSKDLNERQLYELIDALNREPDKWRRRVMAAIGAWLRQLNKAENPDFIKAIACNATQKASFNSIPVSRLRDLYYEFSKKAKTAKTAQQIMADEIKYLQSNN